MADSTIGRGARLFPLHLTPFENYMLWDERSEHPSTFVVQWDFSGPLDREALEAGLTFALSRHPLLQAIIGPGKLNRDCWVSAEGVRAQIDWGGLLVPLELPQGEGIDLHREPGLRIWVRHDDQRAILTTQFHHTTCDGIGAYQFVGDMLWHYAERCGAALEEIPPPLPPENLRKRLRASYKVEAFLDAEGKLRPEFRDCGRNLLRTATPLALVADSPQPVSPPTPFPGVLSADLSAKEYRDFKTAAVERGQMANDALLERLFLSLAAWNERQNCVGDGSLCVLVPLDLREADCFDIPAANIVTEAFVYRSGEALQDRSKLAESLRAELQLIKQDRHRSAFMGMISSAMSLTDELKELMEEDHCVSTAVLSNTGDPTRRFHATFPREAGMVRCGNLLLEDISGVPPLRRYSHASLSLFTYRRTLKVCLRCNPLLYSLSDSQQFLDLYMQSIRDSM